MRLFTILICIILTGTSFANNFPNPGDYINNTLNQVATIKPTGMSTTAFFSPVVNYRNNISNEEINQFLIAGTIKTPEAFAISSLDDYLSIFTIISKPQEGEADYTTKILQYYLQEAIESFYSNGGIDLYIFVPKRESFNAYRASIKLSEQFPKIAILLAPGLSSVYKNWSINVYQTLLQSSRFIKKRFVIIDPPNTTSINELLIYRNNFNSPNGALYSSWILKSDLTGSLVLNPPSASIAGTFVKKELEENISSPPANIAIMAESVSNELSSAEISLLSQNNINPLRQFPHKGIVAWGAYSLVKEDSEDKNISIVRTKKFISYSVETSMKWLHSAPNDFHIWNKVKSSVARFFKNLWHKGILKGTNPSAAYFAKCGLGETMTQVDIRNKRLVLEYGISLLRPTYFSLFKNSFKTSPRNIKLIIR